MSEAGARFCRIDPSGDRSGVCIQAGTFADEAALRRYHYRAGPPATIELVLRAVEARTGELAGVLVVSRPTLNCAARLISWPVLRRMSKRARAQWINRELRTISRVIVDPRYRARGVATALVRAYLRTPLTRRTDAAASMGRVCPFFASCGMRRIVPPPARRDGELRLALRRAGVSPLALLEERSARRVLRRADVRAALGRWQRSARAIVPVDAGWEEIAAHAARRVVAPPWVFVHTSRRHGRRRP